ncbi:unnamed protein product [Paramecium octaurelia]|uniref:Tetratricopeptide repeat protein n=1 Tax=Paramecium octaurelia TaxID=43137 RepID=A0A8S1TYW6_PAROT|nr:unnamed protein product [Paramecium octaurelia]
MVRFKTAFNIKQLKEFNNQQKRRQKEDTIQIYIKWLDQTRDQNNLIHIFRKIVEIQIINNRKLMSQLKAIDWKKHQNIIIQILRNILKKFRLYSESRYTNSAYCLAIILFKMNRVKEALKYYDQARQLDPKYLTYNYNEALPYYSEMNSLCEALEYFNFAIQNNPGNEEYYHYKGKLTLHFLREYFIFLIFIVRAEMKWVDLKKR